jgi:cytochrome c553
MVVVFGPALLTIIGSILVMLFVPHPVPKTASGGQRLYLTHCATCHGADGRGSWRATIVLMRPGNLADPRLMDRLPDDYLFTLIKNGGATIGKPGMPSFGYHMTDDEIRELIRYLRTIPKQQGEAQRRRSGRARRSRRRAERIQAAGRGAAEGAVAGRGAAEGEPSGFKSEARQVRPIRSP